MTIYSQIHAVPLLSLTPLILFAIKLSVTLIPFPFKTVLLLYIIFLALYLTYFTIMGLGLAFSISKSVWPTIVFRFNFSIHMLFYYFYRKFTGIIHLLLHESKGSNAKDIVLVCLVLHPFPQVFSLDNCFLFSRFLSLSYYFWFFSQIQEILMNVIAELILLNCSVPLICHSFSSKRYPLYIFHFCF